MNAKTGGCGRCFKSTFVNGINDEMMMAKMIKLLTTIRKASYTTSEQMLTWAKSVEAQRPQKARLTSIQDNKQFYHDKAHKAKLGKHEQFSVYEREMSIVWHSTGLEKIYSLWKEICRMWKEQTFPGELQKLASRASQGKPKRDKHQ